MSSDSILLEELEVLESIYPSELLKLSERDIRIEAEPDDPLDGILDLKLALRVHYPEGYPEAIPYLKLDILEGDVDDNDILNLLKELNKIADDNLGMAMTFTLVSHLREQLSVYIRAKKEQRRREEMEKERLELEAEEAKTRGTPVTLESFKVWKAKFDKELSAKKAIEEDEKLRGLTPKEREEWKKFTTRLTGRQLFERNKGLEDDTLLEEGTVSVDFSQYERTREEEEQEVGITFSDSD